MCLRLILLACSFDGLKSNVVAEQLLEEEEDSTNKIHLEMSEAVGEDGRNVSERQLRGEEDSD